jgi:Leucine-rich repeat (LRR) protein
LNLGVVSDSNEAGLPIDVELDDESATELAMANVGRCPSVTSLTIQADRIPDAAWSHLQGNKTLQRVDVTTGEISSAVTQALTLCPNLRNLTFRDSSIGRDAMLLLEEMKQLESLYIDSCEFDDWDLQRITKLANLNDLAIDRSEVTDHGFASLANCDALRSLSLTNEDVGAQFTSAISQLTKLQSLDLQFCAIDDEQFNEWSTLTNLNRLIVGYCQFGGTGLQAFTDGVLTELRSFDTLFDATGLRALSKLRTLEEVWLSGVNFTDADLTILNDCHQLKKLTVRGPAITETGLAGLRSQLPNTEISP